MGIFNRINKHLSESKQNNSIIDEMRNHRKKTIRKTFCAWVATNSLNEVYDEIKKEKIIHNERMKDLEIRKQKLQLIVYSEIEGGVINV